MSEELKKKYEKVLFEIVRTIPQEELSVATVRLQPLPYFLSCLCNHGIAPGGIDIESVELFIRDRYLKGNSDNTIRTYLNILDKCFYDYFDSRLPLPEGKTIRAFVKDCIKCLEGAGIQRGSKPNLGYKFEVRLVSPGNHLKKILKNAHPRR